MSRLCVLASSQYGEYASAAVVGASANWSVSCWLYPTQSGTGTTFFSVANSANTTDYFRIDQSAANALRFRCAGGGSTSDASTSNTYNVNAWNHAVVTNASSNADRWAYLNNGTGANNTTSRTPSGLNRTAFGCQDSSTRSAFYSGRIAELACWNVVLSAADRAMLALGVSPLEVRPDALVAFWPLVGKHSPEPDYIGKQDFTLAASPTAAEHPKVYRSIPAGFYVPTPAAPGGGTYQPSMMLMGMG